MRNIVLTGFMGTGKSTAGKKLAKELGLDFLDLDGLIEKEAGATVSEIFEKKGEAAFRSIESGIIKRLAAGEFGDGVVVSTGGGAIVDRLNRQALRGMGVLVCLKASPEEILRRVGDRNDRPLLAAPDRKASVERLLKEREEAYEDCDMVIDTTGVDVKDVVRRIRESLNGEDTKTERSITVELGARSYPIIIKKGLLNEVAARIKALGFKGKAAVVTNPLVGSIYGEALVKSLEKEGFSPVLITIPDGEEYKSLKEASLIYDSLIEHRMERSSPIIALGGGVIGDMAGFVAATYLRGVPYIQVPTTLLSQVDSSVGGKTAVNHPKGKNLIGAFYQPRAVFMDTGALKTLDKREVRAGLAEVVKYGVIRDGDFFTYLEKNAARILGLEEELTRAIERSCELKAEVVGADETEEGLRAVLNFGHTFGHAIEALSGYGKFKHGEAVSIGMSMAAGLSASLGLCAPEVQARIRKLLTAFGLPVDPCGIAAQSFIESMRLDKKVSGGRLRFVLASSIGKVIIREVDEAGLRAYLKQCQGIPRS